MYKEEASLSPVQITRINERQFNATVSLKNGRSAIFESGTSPETVFTTPPTQIRNPTEILTQERTTYREGRISSVETLVHPWIFESHSGLKFFGTADHHELYYFLLNSEDGSTSPNDILLNFDSHDDIEQMDLNPNENRISIGDFVNAGFFPHLKKTWDYYILVAQERTHASGMRHFPQHSEKHLPPQMFIAMERAVQLAKEKKSKIILTIDLDFFGSHDTIGFKPENAAEILIYIFNFIKKNKEHIRLVHFSESLSYVVKKNVQVTELYEQISSLLTLV